ncbi:MAG: HlyD family efflux transporter periplasmic adaptor subunit, partial [Pseudomonadota bacterium]
MQAAETQRDLRAAALDRRAGLLGRGVSTSAEVEEAELALAAAEQSAASRAQATLAAAMRIERSELRRQRAEIALEEARRDLAEIDHRAGFDGLLSDVTAVLGGLVTPNERLGLLIDPTALEAVFRVSNAQYARLLDGRGALKPTPLTVTLELDETPLTVGGVVDRSSAVIDGGETGRLVFARLDLESASLLRPGDFVHVSIAERALDRVATLPAAAVTESGELLVLDAGDRLRAAKVRILRRIGDEVIVAGAPDGARYVRARAPQLGAGVKVRPLGGPDRDAPASGGVDDPQLLVDLAPDRRDRLIGFVEQSEKMSAEAKMRVLSTLRTGRAPADLLERIERGMGDAG